MAFIRRVKRHGHTYLQEVENYREDGKVKQRALRWLGREDEYQASVEAPPVREAAVPRPVAPAWARREAVAVAKTLLTRAVRLVDMKERCPKPGCEHTQVGIHYREENEGSDRRIQDGINKHFSLVLWELRAMGVRVMDESHIGGDENGNGDIDVGDPGLGLRESLRRCPA